VDVVYAGDLMGNMWKFDLSGASQNDWKAPTLLFRAGQPITTSADAGEHPAGGYLVYFGTGKYLEATDVSVPSTKFNTMYGIWDKGAEVTLSELVKQELVPMTDIKGIGYRSSTRNPVDYAVKKGWYVDFMSKPERLVSDPVLRGGRVIFTTIVPVEGECASGGESWLNEFDWLNGGLLDKPPFDTDLNGKVDADDAFASGRHFKRIVSGASIQRSPTGDDLELKFFNESSGTISSVTESANARSARRLSWRQIK
jgi:type IV pilus assembly protein PilY1